MSALGFSGYRDFHSQIRDFFSNRLGISGHLKKSTSVGQDELLLETGQNLWETRETGANTFTSTKKVRFIFMRKMTQANQNKEKGGH